MRVLDIATGTGAAALAAAKIVGPRGSVLGIDISEAMLAEARRKAEAASALNVEFIQANAEHYDLPPQHVDFLLCASGLVMMRDIPAALERWAGWLTPGGGIAFDVPAKPFGLAEMVARAAAEQGIALPYDTVADTAARARALLEHAGLRPLQIRTEVVSDEWIALDEAIAFLDERMDHPAWRALQDAPKSARDATSSAYLAHLQGDAVAGRVRSQVAQHFVYGEKPL